MESEVTMIPWETSLAEPPHVRYDLYAPVPSNSSRTTSKLPFPYDEVLPATYTALPFGDTPTARAPPAPAPPHVSLRRRVPSVSSVRRKIRSPPKLVVRPVAYSRSAWIASPEASSTPAPPHVVFHPAASVVWLNATTTASPPANRFTPSTIPPTYRVRPSDTRAPLASSRPEPPQRVWRTYAPSSVNARIARSPSEESSGTSAQPEPNTSPSSTAIPSISS